MPCALGRMLADFGIEVRGNMLRWSVSKLLADLRAGELAAHHVRYPAEYLVSTFPNMPRWFKRWWEDDPSAGPYPRFYLNQCCGFEAELDGTLHVATDALYREAAGTRPVVAVALSGRTRSRSYRFPMELTQALDDADCFVWSKFDGSQPLDRTLGQLQASDLLITVASAPQWLANSVGCPTLVIPGHVPPAVLGATRTVQRHLECQFCMALECVEKTDYACMSVPAAAIAADALRFLETAARR